MNNKSYEDKAFTSMMGKIAAQAEAERVLEARNQKRQLTLSRVKSACVFLFGAALLAGGYFYRAPLQHFAEEKFMTKPKVGQIDGKTGQALSGIQAQASKRDAVLEEITGK